MPEQTALTELLQWVRSTLPMDLDTPRLIEEKIESLLPKEKEQIDKAHYDGYYREDLYDTRNYYNETYGKKA